jgi:hypothetical protein
MKLHVESIETERGSADLGWFIRDDRRMAEIRRQIALSQQLQKCSLHEVCHCLGVSFLLSSLKRFIQLVGEE